MDNRIFYPDYFYAHSIDSHSTVMVLAWPERNGYGWQPLADVSTDAPTNFYYENDFSRYYRKCTEEEEQRAKSIVENFIQQRGGPQHEVARYTYTNRTRWA